jgi:predicted negative regulator of RcsB-dependent stress response
VLHTGQARSLAKMRRVRETLIAVGTADDHYAHSTPANEPFMAYYTAARHAELTGLALADLAISGRDHSEATNRLTEAVTGLTEAHARAISQTKLACLTMATGDPAEAAALGTAALDAVSALRSRRVTEGLRELSRHTAAHQHINEVAHLRQRISTLGRVP